MKTQVIPLDEQDDLVSASEKISWAQAPRLLLVFSPAAEAGWDVLALRLLHRRARALGAQLGVVARSGELRLRCAEVGIPVFPSALEAQRQPWPAVSSFEAHPRLRRNLRRWRRSLQRSTPRALPLFWRLLATGAGVLAALVVAFLFVPSAVITIRPALATQTVEVPLEAAEARSNRRDESLPARWLQVNVEGSQTMPASGETLLPVRTATGRVRLENLTSAALTVPAGTVVRTTGAPVVRFATQEEVTLPPGPGSFAEVAVQALQAGSAGNLPAGTLTAIEGALGAALAVTNLQPTTGGTEELVSMPTLADRQALRQRLLARLTEACRSALASSALPGMHLILATMRVAGEPVETFFPGEGQPGERLALAMQLTCEAQYVVESDWLALARRRMDAALPAGFSPLEATPSCTFQEEFRLRPDGSLRGLLRCERPLRSQPDRLAVALTVQGKAPQQAEQALLSAFPLDETPRIAITPSWWPRLPFLPGRISLVLLNP